MLDKTLRHNLGVPVDHVVRVDFNGFVRIVDAVGGVTVEVEKPIADIFPDPHSATGEFRMDLPAGPQHLDGRTALVSANKTSGGISRVDARPRMTSAAVSPTRSTSVPAASISRAVAAS